MMTGCEVPPAHCKPVMGMSSIGSVKAREEKKPGKATTVSCGAIQ
jgi:hypothetical protein